MPQVLALVIAGAGLYAGFKWISRVMSDAQLARKRDAEPRESVARGRGVPKDLGTLEYDPATGVYRPRSE